MPQKQRLDALSEKTYYDHYENVPDDPGYQQFLSRYADVPHLNLTNLAS